MVEEACAVAIMAKASLAGEVKTRLVPPLSHAQAAEFNTCCIADVAAAIEDAAGRVPICGFAAYHPLGSEGFFREVLPAGFGLLPPREPTLGKSLVHAVRELLAQGWGAVCLVNSDSPNLPSELLADAVRRLQQPGDRVVLGPAADGGYYLIGLKRLHLRLFDEIDWSTERVYRQTLARAVEVGLDAVSLPEWYDVDDADSLAQLWRQLRADGDRRAPRTRSFLDGLVAADPGLRRLFDGGG
jgi:rSAM/selenodomain-associated transferase 1